MQREWWKNFQQYLVQEVPAVLAHCEFECRSINCHDCPLIKKTTLSHYDSNLN